jgi:hypothetical protein
MTADPRQGTLTRLYFVCYNVRIVRYCRIVIIIFLFVFAFPAIAPVLCACPVSADCDTGCAPAAPHADEDGCELCLPAPSSGVGASSGNFASDDRAALAAAAASIATETTPEHRLPAPPALRAARDGSPLEPPLRT